MNILSNKNICATLLLGAILLPGSVSASSIYIDTHHSEFFVGDTILLSVRIDSEGKNINAVEGEVVLDHAADAVSLTNINTAGSILSLWPGKPLPSERNTRISFTGGSPGGFVSKDAIVFNVVLKLEKEGQIALSPSGIEVYIHDGKGTRDEVSQKDLSITVLPRESGGEAVDDWGKVVSTDTTPPEPFAVYLGQEESVFDGKKFLSFSTTDEQSGISYYEVTENTLPSVRSKETYVLEEQHNPVKVVVVAYDSAGNARESVYNSPTSTRTASRIPVMIFIGILLLIVLLFVAYRKMKKNKHERIES